MASIPEQEIAKMRYAVQEAKLTAIESKLDILLEKFDKLSTSTTAAVAAASVAPAAAPSGKKKKDMAITGETKTTEVKKTHPSLPEITESAWNLKKTGDDFEKRMDWFVMVLTKYPTHLHTIIGAEEVKRITESADYNTILGQCKKQGDREKAKSLLNALKAVRTRENTFGDISKKLVDDYNAQLAVLNSSKIGQLTSETASQVENAAASAMANLLSGQPATIHTSTSTAAPAGGTPVDVAAQLAALTAQVAASQSATA